MIRALPFLLIATSASAGGLDAPQVASDPCPMVILQNDGSMTEVMFRQWLAIRAMSCGHEPRAFFDRASGLPLTDDEITRRIFNNSRVEVIPLPGALWAMLAALGGLAMLRRRRG